jgi:hypothetical protein
MARLVLPPFSAGCSRPACKRVKDTRLYCVDDCSRQMTVLGLSGAPMSRRPSRHAEAETAHEERRAPRECIHWRVIGREGGGSLMISLAGPCSNLSLRRAFVRKLPRHNSTPHRGFRNHSVSPRFVPTPPLARPPSTPPAPARILARTAVAVL